VGLVVAESWAKWTQAKLRLRVKRDGERILVELDRGTKKRASITA
jgi:hypothetical protein